MRSSRGSLLSYTLFAVLSGSRVGQRGQLLPIFAIGIIALLGFASFGIDIGNWRYQQRVLQSAADSAAIAGATALSYSANADVQQAARTDAADNGVVNDGIKTFVTAQVGASSGEYVGQAGAVQATVEKKVPTFFSRLVGRMFQDIKVRSVAVVANANRACLVAMDPNGSGITANGAILSLPTCGISSNSSLTFHGAQVDAQSITYASSLTARGTSFGIANPTQSAVGPDPCDSLPGCSYFKTFVPNPSCAGNNLSVSGQNITLYPGTYCGGLSIHGASVTFSPGIYTIQGDLDIGGSTVVGHGVSFYQQSGQFRISGTTQDLSAPATGPGQGMILFEPLSNTSGLTFNGAHSDTFQGGMYLPGGSVTMNGSSTAWFFMAAAQICFNGQGLTVPSGDFPGSKHIVLAD